MLGHCPGVFKQAFSGIVREKFGNGTLLAWRDDFHDNLGFTTLRQLVRRYFNAVTRKDRGVEFKP